jgi:hypothetical protein
VQLRKDGIWILRQLKSEEIGKVDQNAYHSENIYPHELLVYLDDNIEEFKMNNRNGLPTRILTSREVELDSLPKDNNGRRIELYLWASYLKKRGLGIKLKWKQMPEDGRFDVGKEVFIDDHYFEFERHRNIYYEMGCAHHRAKTLTTPKMDEHVQVLKSKYIENVFCKIAIIDERVQGNIITKKNYKEEECIRLGYSNKFIGFKYKDQLDLYHYFLKQNLIIPNYDEADLNRSNFGTLDKKKSIASRIKSFINRNNVKDADYFVIHLGVLEKMLAKETPKIEAEISGLINKLGIDVSKIIITSGRGKPDNLPKDIKFVPLSSIQNAVESLNDKFLLTQILYNARRYKE